MAGNDKTSNKRDPAWKYCDPIKGPGVCRYVKCHFCDKIITAGVTRFKEHLAGTHRDTKPCEVVTEEARNEMKALLKKSEQAKIARYRELNKLVESGPCFSTPTSTSKRSSSSGSVSSRGVRGSMDRFVNDLTDDDDAVPTEDEDKEDNDLSAEEARRLTCLDIGWFFTENSIPAKVASSPSFVNMLRSVGNYGSGLKPPSPYELSTWILKEQVSTTDAIVDDVRKTWTQTGVSILSDGWKDIRGRSLVNFLVNNPYGTVFLKCVDVSDSIEDANLIFKLLDEVVEEVGEDIVVQVITDNTVNYKLAGKKLMEKRTRLWWTPCAAHCIDLILEQIGSLPQHKNALLKAKKVSTFIHNHEWVLALMRKHTGKDLLRPTTSRFVTDYLTLQSMLDLRQPLEAMFASSDWFQSSYSKKSEGKAAKKIIFERAFWLNVAYAIKTTKPLVQVLRMTDSEKMPGMGFLYGAMDKAKEEIAKILGGEEGSYKEIWSIIDEKWEFQRQRHLPAAAYFLNPHFQYNEGFSTNYEVKMGFFACLEKLIPNERERETADLQLDSFRNRDGLFGCPLARSSCKKRSPADWWIQFGDQTPELTSFAVKILSLTCSSSACERNWSTFNVIHTKRRNKLTTKNLNTLAYVMYNKKLKDRHLKRKAFTAEQDSLVVGEETRLDDEYVAEWVDQDVGDDHQENADVGGVAQGSGSRQQTRKRKKLGAYGSKKLSKFQQAKDVVEGLVDEEDETNEHEERICGACGKNYTSDEFWICCGFLCERWFHGKCVKITPAQAEHIKNYICPTCSSNKRACT